MRSVELLPIPQVDPQFAASLLYELVNNYSEDMRDQGLYHLPLNYRDRELALKGVEAHVKAHNEDTVKTFLIKESGSQGGFIGSATLIPDLVLLEPNDTATSKLPNGFLKAGNKAAGFVDRLRNRPEIVHTIGQRAVSFGTRTLLLRNVNVSFFLPNDILVSKDLEVGKDVVTSLTEEATVTYVNGTAWALAKPSSTKEAAYLAASYNVEAEKRFDDRDGVKMWPKMMSLVSRSF